MAEPVPGIQAVPDEHNARYFHVIVDGPRDVRGDKELRVEYRVYIFCCSPRLKVALSSWSCFYQKNIQCRLQKCGL